MNKFSFTKRNTYTSPNRSSYHAARQRREEFWRKVRAITVAVCVLMAALAVLHIFPGNGNSSSNKQPAVTAPFISANDDNNPLKGKKLYVDPISNASRQADEWRTTAPEKAIMMDKLADQPSARWYSNGITFDDVHGFVAAAQDQSAIPLAVAYFLPNRDCNKYSSGGAANEGLYYDYIDTYAKAIGNMDAVVILEPDALVHTISKDPDGQPCLTDAERKAYFTLLTYAVDRFKSLPATLVYIDAGNSGWATDADEMAGLLKKAGIEKADGFSLNISNFQKTQDTVEYGNAISNLIDKKHYIIDTSRNGIGTYQNDANPAYNWCNPPGRAMGHYPTINTGISRVDAFLYIKNIGESDGTDPDYNKCFGGPPAGTWWPDYAVGLVERWPADLQYDFEP